MLPTGPKKVGRGGVRRGACSPGGLGDEGELEETTLQLLQGSVKLDAPVPAPDLLRRDGQVEPRVPEASVVDKEHGEVRDPDPVPPERVVHLEEPQEMSHRPVPTVTRYLSGGSAREDGAPGSRGKG